MQKVSAIPSRVVCRGQVINHGKVAGEEGLRYRHGHQNIMPSINIALGSTLHDGLEKCIDISLHFILSLLLN